MTKETKAESYINIINTVNERQRNILEILQASDGMTAKEIAVILQKQKIIPISERNHTSPRLTELKELGLVEVVGKKPCIYTGRTVTVWQIMFNTK